MMIRSFRNSDLSRILEFKRQSVRVSFPTCEFDDTLFLRLLKKAEPGSVLVADDNDKVIGYVFLRTKKTSTGTYGVVHHIFVDPDYRGKGIATELMGKAEDYFRSRGVKAARSTITITNEPSLKMVRKLGYREKRIVFEKDL